MTSDSDNNTVFHSLGEYKFPPQPTEHYLRQLYSRFWRVFNKEKDQPLLANDQLKRITSNKLDKVAAPPACGSLLEELSETLREWAEQESPKSWIQMIVLPPGDVNDVVGSWAKDNHHQIIIPPPRNILMDADNAYSIDLSGDGIVVIPQLERWFLRHQNGLGSLRHLLKELSQLERHCVIGCNSWAWEFLCKAVEIDLIVSDPVTFKPFDGKRLYDWLSTLSHSEETKMITFRLSENGQDVWEANDKGKPKHDFFNRLAAQSLGIPWVAWHLWRTSLHSDINLKNENMPSKMDTSDDEKTLWVGALDEFILPEGNKQSALLTLHALLLHDCLTAEELATVLPLVGESPIVSTLINAGLVRRIESQLHCNPAAYPAIRMVLSAAGHPKGQI